MYHLRQFVKLLFYSILFWSIAFCLFIVIRFLAYGEEQALDGLDTSANEIFNWLHFGIILGILIGTFYAIVEFLFERYITKNIYLGLALLLKAGIYFSFLLLSSLYIIRLIELDLNINLSNKIWWWLKNDVFWLVISYFFLSSFIFQFIRLTNQKFGKGVLLNMLTGKYRKPVEEKRLFMFIDLKSATPLAEDLGHYKYSQLLQDCFFDLNKLLDRYSAEVYQYVGDEAVVSWKYKNGIKHNRCVDLYFHFQRVLHKRSKYYLKHYKAVPFFKAGVHGGKLTVTEVGTLKKELAYHGDVINTTSRIQEACNTYNEAFLISEDVMKNLRLKSKYISDEIGDLLLKGKTDRVKIYAIKEFESHV